MAAKGRIDRVWEVFCVCGQWERLGTGSPKEAAKRRGWKLDRVRGWTCPACRQLACERVTIASCMESEQAARERLER